MKLTVESETEKKEWARVASEIFKEEAAKATGANWRLMKDLQSLKDNKKSKEKSYEAITKNKF